MKHTANPFSNFVALFNLCLLPRNGIHDLPHPEFPPWIRTHQIDNLLRIFHCPNACSTLRQALHKIASYEFKDSFRWRAAPTLPLRQRPDAHGCTYSASTIRRSVKTRDQVSRHPWPRPVRTPRIFRRQAPPRPILHLVIDPGGNGDFVSTVLHISPRLITLSIINEIRYHQVMIQSFKCPDTQSLFQRKRTARFVNIERVALRKLAQLEWASRIDDLRIPPNNRLELLKGNRVGQYSIRINAQWRVCFRWKNGNAFDVEIVDYH